MFRSNGSGSVSPAKSPDANYQPSSEMEKGNNEPVSTPSDGKSEVHTLPTARKTPSRAEPVTPQESTQGGRASDNSSHTTEHGDVVQTRPPDRKDLNPSEIAASSGPTRPDNVTVTSGTLLPATVEHGEESHSASLKRKTRSDSTPPVAIVDHEKEAEPTRQKHKASNQLQSTQNPNLDAIDTSSLPPCDQRLISALQTVVPSLAKTFASRGYNDRMQIDNEFLEDVSDEIAEEIASKAPSELTEKEQYALTNQMDINRGIIVDMIFSLL